MTDNQAPEDLGAPASYLVLKAGTPVYDRSGSGAGKVEHVLADEQQDVFHGLIIGTADGHRFARADLVDGLYERGVIIAEPASQLPEPSADPPARLVEQDEGLGRLLRTAWERLTAAR
jgi:hypothetical protein